MFPLFDILSPVLNKVLSYIPNPLEKAKAEMEFKQHLADQEQEILKAFIAQDQGQIEVNKVEAASSSMFVAGWRPFVGWVCGFGVAWAFVLKPMLDWLLAIVSPGITTPVIASGDLLSLLLGLLGMGAIRSFEKVKGVASK
jgi:hypothetical protein